VTALVVNEGGKDYSCEYAVKSGMVTVRILGFSKTTQVGGSPPVTIARMMALEIIREATLK
jgi:hypothetical protein